jgi:hypothetical protein
MEVEYREDRAAYRRHIRGMILFGLAAVLYLPAMLLVLALLAVWIGREASRSYTGEIFLAGFVALVPTWLYGAYHLISYRCPRCGRRLRRVYPQGQSDSNICYLCTDCLIVWDLGWNLGEKA